MRAKDLHAGLLAYGACGPALRWLEDRIYAKPDASFEDVWVAALKYNGEREPGDQAEKHVGRSWCAWLCRQAGIEVHEGTFSGMPKVNRGPSVTSLVPGEVESAVRDLFAEFYLSHNRIIRAFQETERYDGKNTGTNR
jgi:hypothetical protein